MIDLGPRILELGRPVSMGKRKLCNDLDIVETVSHKRRKTVPGTRLVDLQILSEDGTLVEEATIEEITAPPAARLEIVVVDENWSCALSPDATIINLDDLGPLGGTSSLHSTILRETQQQQQLQQLQQLPPSPAPTPSPTPSPRALPADTADNDIGNLDWLINFKVDSVFDSKKGSTSATTSRGGASSAMSASRESSAVTPTGHSETGGAKAAQAARASQSPPATPNPSPQSNRYSGPGKPPFTYTELIELALKDKGKLTVKEIYQWITKHFPFYKATDERWKNSVRHNLSINPHFRKESKAPQGAGHLWVVMDSNNKAKNSWKEERIQNFLASQAVSAAEVAEATASIATPAPVVEDCPLSPPPEREPPLACPAPAPFTTLPTKEKKEHIQLNTWWSERVSLERSAEEILSGVKREVGVEFLTPMDLDADDKLELKEDKGFLYGDLTTEQVIAESGLQDELVGLYLLNDMTANITTDSLFSDDLNFGLELPLSG